MATRRKFIANSLFLVGSILYFAFFEDIKEALSYRRNAEYQKEFFVYRDIRKPDKGSEKEYVKN